MEESELKPGRTRQQNLLIACAGCAVISICLSLIAIAGILFWLGSGPEGGVKISNEMDQYALDYIQANNILRSGEDLIAYYDVTTSMDGTEAAILTTGRVMYHKNGATTAIPLDEITNVQHRYESWIGDIIEITGSAGEMIKIEIAPYNNGETFYNALMNALEIAEKRES